MSTPERSHLQPDLVLDEADTRSLISQAHLVPVADAVFRLEGMGAVDCLQGVFTNDVVKPGADALVWGAILTPKGMIISDAWIRRDGAAAWVIVPRSAGGAIRELFARSFPPRLVTVTDRTDAVAVFWLLDGAVVPPEGLDIARPHGIAPFTGLLISANASQDAGVLARAGWPTAPAPYADAAKLVIGWPTLGREIDEKTLPQEVRFDELGGVRYDKGCYTGQETVARLHFRGHANRTLRGLQWIGNGPVDAVITLDEKIVGSVRTLALLGERRLALAMLRHEVVPGDTVIAGGAAAVVLTLPFELGTGAVA